MCVPPVEPLTSCGSQYDPELGPRRAPKSSQRHRRRPRRARKHPEIELSARAHQPAGRFARSLRGGCGVARRCDRRHRFRSLAAARRGRIDGPREDQCRCACERGARIRVERSLSHHAVDFGDEVPDQCSAPICVTSARAATRWVVEAPRLWRTSRSTTSTGGQPPGAFHVGSTDGAGSAASAAIATKCHAIAAKTRFERMRAASSIAVARGSSHGAVSRTSVRGEPAARAKKSRTPRASIPVASPMTKGEERSMTFKRSATGSARISARISSNDLVATKTV